VQNVLVCSYIVTHNFGVACLSGCGRFRNRYYCHSLILRLIIIEGSKTASRQRFLVPVYDQASGFRLQGWAYFTYDGVNVKALVTGIKDSYYGRTDGRSLGLWDASRSPQLVKLV
jgi:hypothetical protein